MKKITFLLTFAAIALQPSYADAMWSRFTTRFAPTYASIFGVRSGVQKTVRSFTGSTKVKPRFYTQWSQKVDKFLDEPKNQNAFLGIVTGLNALIWAGIGYKAYEMHQAIDESCKRIDNHLKELVKQHKAWDQLYIEAARQNFSQVSRKKELADEDKSKQNNPNAFLEEARERQQQKFKEAEDLFRKIGQTAEDLHKK